MGVEFAAERRLLAEDELQPVMNSHYPDLEIMERPELVDLARWLRDQRARARDLIHERRRARRGKGEPRAGAADVPSERGLAAKKQVFARALKRVNHQIAALDARARHARSVASMQAALAQRRAAPVHHPDAGRSARSGMRARPAVARPGIITGGRVGSVSQAGRNAQAARDSRG